MKMNLRLGQMGGATNREVRNPSGFGDQVIMVAARYAGGLFPNSWTHKRWLEDNTRPKSPTAHDWFDDKVNGPTGQEYQAMAWKMAQALNERFGHYPRGTIVELDEETLHADLDHSWTNTEYANGPTPEVHRAAVMGLLNAFYDWSESKGYRGRHWARPAMWWWRRGEDPTTDLEMIQRSEYVCRVAYVDAGKDPMEFYALVCDELRYAKLHHKGKKIALCLTTLYSQSSPSILLRWMPVPFKYIWNACILAEMFDVEEVYFWTNNGGNEMFVSRYNLWFRYRAWRLVKRFGLRP